MEYHYYNTALYKMNCKTNLDNFQIHKQKILLNDRVKYNLFLNNYLKNLNLFYKAFNNNESLKNR